jgi:hypothetical protein
VAYLSAKYGIHGIRVSPYNSRANGKIESGHRPLRQSIIKATGGNPSKWFWFFPQTLWADRITVRRGMGCSPYFVVTGAHPAIPLDIVEATWLVEIPGRKLSMAELIGYRAQALAKHSTHVALMRDCVSAEKRAAVKRYEEVHKHTIQDFDFKPGDLVLVRNTMVEKSLNAKMLIGYWGPVVVVRRTAGGSYIVAEMDGAVFQSKIAQFRVLPYLARERIDLPEGILKLIDLNPEQLDAMIIEGEDDLYEGRDFQFENVRLAAGDDEESDSERMQSDEEETSAGDREDSPEPAASESQSPPETRRVKSVRTRSRRTRQAES